MLKVGGLLLISACGFSAQSTALGPKDGGGDGPPDGSVPGCGVAEIVAHGNHTCGRRTDGSVFCWGAGNNGELGVTPLSYRCAVGALMFYCSPSPRHVDIPPATALGLGDTHSCAVTGTDTYCWGLNKYGAFGDTTTAGSSVPKVITQRTGATAISGGLAHTCSISGGNVSCSGGNFAGEVGNNSMSQQLATTQVMSAATVVSLGDYISCVIDDQMHPTCWGTNMYQQIDTSHANKLTPTLINGLDDIRSVAVGRDHICVADGAHVAKCWGNNGLGQLGTGDMIAQPSPSPVLIQNVVDVAANHNHSCVRDTGGAVWCFGEGYGVTPVHVALPRPATRISSGYSHDCAVLDDASGWCWGSQDLGQLGNGTNSSTRTLTPQAVPLCQ